LPGRRLPPALLNTTEGEFDFQSFQKLGGFGILGLHFPESLGGAEQTWSPRLLQAKLSAKQGWTGGSLWLTELNTFLCADTIFATARMPSESGSSQAGFRRVDRMHGDDGARRRL